MAAAPKPKLLIVDTNAFLRLYSSPVFPLLQQQFGDYQLLTLPSLIKEFKDSSRLVGQYPTVAKNPKWANLQSAAIQLSNVMKNQVSKRIKELKPIANNYLEDFCDTNNVVVFRQLSSCDAELLATAVVTRATIATDEWPLRKVVEYLLEDEDSTYAIALMSSIEVLALLEQNGKVSRDQRIETVQKWIDDGENLLRGWRSRYAELFGEQAPG